DSSKTNGTSRKSKRSKSSLPRDEINGKNLQKGCSKKRLNRGLGSQHSNDIQEINSPKTIHSPTKLNYKHEQEPSSSMPKTAKNTFDEVPIVSKVDGTDGLISVSTFTVSNYENPHKASDSIESEKKKVIPITVN